ncbi:alanine racemase [Jidongwangia harbinensis]|uniref:alanine racemase n=1 Tax=Jidongwangia harbinensis TaxID=2878561 RepID=UPI001CD96369|nr:alanine racemase [Jidongwangia harbinensis]MCA2214683.1 alanine racemase [Jidongwangia harbinensis]
MLDIPAGPIDWRAKGFWAPDGVRTAAELAETRPGLFDGGFTWPVLVVRRAAVEANVATMAAYCARHGFDFAPHAKTTMAPGLIAAQFAAGAWGMTVATPNQALVLRRLGVSRVLIANQVLDPTALRWLAAEHTRGAEVYFQVDSVAGVEVAAAAVRGHPGVLRVLVELGHAGGRTGCRTLADLASVARAAAAADGLDLVGVTGYEGQLAELAEVDAFLDRLAEGVRTLSAAGLLPARPLVSAGGSAWFDRVAERLAGAGPGRLILRSGASVTHDDGFYRERTPFNRVPGEGPLVPALEMWAQVLSTPEPGLAIAGMGKRDAPIDEGLPVVTAIRRGGTLAPAPGLAVTRLNDHHTYLSVPPGVQVTPGDLLRFGLSHPCTAFDKWREIPVVDDDLHVVDVLHTYF